MKESNGDPVVSKRSRFFTLVKSSYSLRNTPARSHSKPKLNPNPSKIMSHENSDSSNAANHRAKGNPEYLESGKNMEKEEEEEYLLSRESKGRERVKQTLRGFREVYHKLMEGLEKEPGDRSRPDLVAYNLLKENNKDCSNANRCLGGIPGVRIGDAYEFRVELMLIGLHCLLQANIDYVTRDERLIAASIVFNYWGKNNNNVRSSGDVLVCSGSGNECRDQKMEGGNLALKNSIDAGTPVRVILGFRYGKRILYVYGGLYSVEKYWIKKGDHNCKVFLFQLKRLEGQAKVDIKQVEKLISSKAVSETISNWTIFPSKSTSQETSSSIHSPAASENCTVNSKDNVVSDAKCLGKRRREQEEESEAESRKRLKQTLHEFIVTYEKLAEEDEAKGKRKPKKKKEPGEHSRLDLDAYKICKDKNKDLNNVARRLGAIPGVQVGDKFYFRVELALLGLHCQLQADIDWVRKDGKLVAASVASARLGQYNSDLHKLDVLLYCGSGSKYRHQKMTKGNLALKNSIDLKTAVRVFYGFKKNKATIIYIYFGLYLVEKYWRKKDDDGHYVFMFRLRRLPGQANINIEETKRLLSLKSSSVHKYTEDISRGKEKVPIRVVNTIDDERLLPFEYITEVIYPLNYNPAPLEGCNCINGCSDSETCACAVRNGGEIPFNSKGFIVEAKPLVYECGPSCQCPPSCHNRVSQHGIKFPLEVFKTKTMGWGVRSRTFIPSGSFICEYVGEFLEDEEAQKRTTDEYLFAIGNNYYDESLWEGLSSIPCLQKSTASEAEEDGGFTIDASRYGNIGKFINHNCTPNLYAQNLLYDHDDKRMPHIMFFACEDIPPLQELTYHYNYTIDDVQDSEGNIRKKSCYCGSIECTGRLY